MRIYTLKENFTKDLESFLKNPLQIPCLTEWNPKRVAAPERHLSLGKDAGLSIDMLVYTLEKENVVFDNISSLLRIYLNRTVLRNSPAIDPVKEQIWLFAQKWFSEYYEILTEPDILKSDFFRSHNDDFLALLTKMLEVHPKKRISFQQALLEWDPSNSLLQATANLAEEEGEENEKEKDEEKAEVKETNPKPESVALHVQEKCITPISLLTTSETAPLSSVSASASSSVSWIPLVLNEFRRNEEHNKTRKNPRN